MKHEFKDHFSDGSKYYHKFRPQYPEKLIAYLATLSPSRQKAWDCATGTGQAALMLADYYREVIATDASQEQIDHAPTHKNISYRVATAEQSGIADASIDLITVAQALHWFNLKDFALEVNRVLVSKGVLAVWSYHLIRINRSVDSIVNHLYRNTLKNFWPKERAMIDAKYHNIRMPLQSLSCPVFSMVEHWNFDRFIGFLKTWSAVNRYQTHFGNNPIDNIHEALIKAWGPVEAMNKVSWELTVKIWRKNTV